MDMKKTVRFMKARHVLYSVLFVYIAVSVNADGRIPGVELLLPATHTALSGDLHIQIASSSFPPLLLQVSRLEGTSLQTLTTVRVLPEARALSLNKTIVKIPCGYFSKGGTYYILLKKQLPNYYGSNRTDNGQSSMVTRSLDVRWPMPQLSLTPEHVETYPERSVTAILEFPEVVCPPVNESPVSAIPEFWLELYYCGHSLLNCDNDNYNRSRVQVLYSEQVRGFPGRREITLRCELFGLAGHYALLLRPTTPSTILPYTAAYVKADWSNQFVFNVHARSIFPCEGHSGGITVLFQYPSCILASGDRVRLFAKLRANVASLTPPTSLEYIAEQKITRGQHSLHFDCDLFTERYVEYCFVYVSQAITGAVADVRMDCVPTLPVSESESGGWGPWSSWTTCSSTCMGGTRNRYRFCDSPPPRYGAKFCEGPRVQTEKCGLDVGNSWECIYGSPLSSEIVADLPDIQDEMSPHCRCGCAIHLGVTKPKRLITASSQSCPGRTFWLIQADEDQLIQFKVEQFRLPCESQWLKVRDGSSLSANLLADLSGTDSSKTTVNSSGSNLLLEFYSKESIAADHECAGGFLAQALQIKLMKSNITGMPIIQGIIPTAALKLTAVHIAAIFFLSALSVATILLGAQYLCRYRKYHVAQVEDQDSLTDAIASCGSIPVATRASSSTTLLSEVISLTRLRPMKSRLKHTRLRESMDVEMEREVTLAKEEDTLSATSTLTLTQQETATTGACNTSEVEETTTSSLPCSPCLNDNTLRRASIKSDKDTLTEKSDGSSLLSRRFSNVSTATLTNGCYSPARGNISTAKIKHTNEKECKDRRNREKLLAGPMGSEFSIAGPDGDLEMDYYDYNVTNAGAAPGSYLGMDPAFLVWIPPFDDSGDIIRDLDDTAPTFDEMKPQEYIDPGSNKESPEEELLLPKEKMRSVSNGISKTRSKNNELNQPDKVPLLKDKRSEIVTIQLHEFPTNKLGKSLPNVAEMDEKETRVEKLNPTSDSSILSEIRYADDDEDDCFLTDTTCNIGKSYKDSNILFSS